MLESAQDAPSVLPDGAWTTQPKTRFEFYKVLDAGAPAWTTEAYFPLEQYIYSQERVAPLWNPYQAFGSPLAANMQSQPFSPLTMMLLLHLTPRTYNLYLLTRLLIVGVGMFVYLRYFVAFWAALCGAIITSLGGYYNFYVAMPHISVEMLLPFCLVAVEYVIRSRSYRALLTLSGIVFLIIVGGMPESTALQLTFITMYVLCRVATDGMLSGSRTRCLLTFGGGTLAGILLASFLILPFTEFMHHSFNVHETRYTAGVVTGMLHAPLNDGLWAYLFPLLLGHPDGINPLNYVGVIPFFAMLVALGCLWRWKLEDRSLNVLTIFFSLSVIWVVGKRCGLEPINMIGALPVFKMVNFIKYNEPLLTVSVAVLAAIGVEHIYRRRMPYVVLEAALFLAVLTIPLALIMSWEDLRRIFGDNHVDIQLVLIAVGVPSSVLLMTILAFLHYKSVGDGGRRVAVFLACAITAELSLNVIVPDYRIIGTLPYDRQNPYAASPYITFLKKQILNQERIVGRDVVLHPNWASAFQLCDIRDLDALYYDKYFRFLWTFLPGAPSGSDELRNRYTGGIAAYNFDTPLQRRLLQLSSVRYLLSERAFPPGAATSQELPHSAHPESQTRPLFNLIYAKEAMVYQYDDVLPRAALYFRAEAPRGGDDGLKRLADPSLDIFSTVVLDAAQMDQNQKAIVRGMDSNIEFRRVEPAQIRKYTSREVEVQSQADRSAILVLNDSDYPGWSVDVDGRKDRIISANYIFRGVMIPPGKHLVRFTYDPARFRIGKAISFTTLLALIAGALLRKTIAEKNSRSMLAVQQTSTC